LRKESRASKRLATLSNVRLCGCTMLQILETIALALFQFTFLGDGANNGPPPSCKLEDCLNCDETMSGPGFQTVAARSRRRSGLLSMIVRDCDNLLIVDHKPPCEVTKAKARKLQGEQSNVKPETPEKYRPPTPTETCIYVDSSLGLGGYSSQQGNTLLTFFFGGDRYDSLYTTCFRYDWNSVLSGFWQNQKDMFGSAYAAALTFGIIATILGGITTAFTWSSMCVTYHPNAWKRMTVMYGFCSLCMFLTMVFFASEVCEAGCTIEKAGIMSIVSGFMWFFAAGLCFKSAPADLSVPKSTCCCCPIPIISDQGAYKAIPIMDEEVKAEETPPLLAPKEELKEEQANVDSEQGGDNQ